MTATEPRVDRFTGVGVLSPDEQASALRILQARPVENIFVSARVQHGGFDTYTLGCAVWGYWEDGELVSMLHAGANFVPVNATPAALNAFVEYAGPNRRCSSIIGPADIAMTLWRKLSARWGANWERARAVRPAQPVMVIDTEPAVDADERVQPIRVEALEPYVTAAAAMYTEEVGISPITGSSSSYRQYIRQLIESGRAFGHLAEGRVRYKSDLGSVAGEVCQVQGVWLDPAWRGKRLAAPAMAQVVRLARRRYPIVTLYVNDFNLPARATYRRVGFSEVGVFATVMY